MAARPSWLAGGIIKSALIVHRNMSEKMYIYIYPFLKKITTKQRTAMLNYHFKTSDDSMCNYHF